MAFIHWVLVQQPPAHADEEQLMLSCDRRLWHSWWVLLPLKSPNWRFIGKIPVGEEDNLLGIQSDADLGSFLDL